MIFLYLGWGEPKWCQGSASWMWDKLKLLVTLHFIFCNAMSSFIVLKAKRSPHTYFDFLLSWGQRCNFVALNKGAITLCSPQRVGFLFGGWVRTVLENAFYWNGVRATSENIGLLHHKFRGLALKIKKSHTKNVASVLSPNGTPLELGWILPDPPRYFLRAPPTF